MRVSFSERLGDSPNTAQLEAESNRTQIKVWANLQKSVTTTKSKQI